ncbi:MAG TPA: cupin domain-containing protein [Yinghuangia sp.]|nr:cupin domain-containing protein [Yinghuangia sp.]
MSRSVTVTRSAEARRTETPNAVMTTFASPSQGDSPQSLWRVEAGPGAAGPLHGNNRPQVWTILAGRAIAEVDGEKTELAVGDTLVIPAGLPRRFVADAETGYTAICMGPGDSQVTAEGQDAIPLPWAR